MRALRTPISRNILSEEGSALLMIFVAAAAISSMIVLTPSIFTAVRTQQGTQIKKFQLQNTVGEMQSFMKYPNVCKRILSDLVRLEDLKDKHDELKEEKISKTVQKHGSLAAASPSKGWTSPGPTHIELGDPLFPNTRVYRAMARIRSVAKIAGAAPKTEESAVYISFGEDGKVDFCESTTISLQDQLTIEDRMCRLTVGGEIPNSIYDPVSRQCRPRGIAVAKS